MVKFNEKALSELRNNELLKLEIMRVTGNAYSTVNRWIYKKNIKKLGTIAINETIKNITGENLINF